APGTAAPAPAPGGQEALRQAARAAAQEAAALDAYFAAGYVWEDAVELGGLWNVDPVQAKVSAGGELLAGRELPVDPGGQPHGAPAPSPELAAYFGAGYGWDEAVELARLWNVEPVEAKTTAGAHLLSGRDLPLEPGTAPGAPPAPEDPRAPQREAFSAAGYTYDDAVELGELWGVDPWEAKALAGERLLAGEPLPVLP
ncbi:hypothetical protein GTR00_20670, partial [Kineococcus sp. T90]